MQCASWCVRVMQYTVLTYRAVADDARPATSNASKMPSLRRWVTSDHQVGTVSSQPGVVWGSQVRAAHRYTTHIHHTGLLWCQCNFDRNVYGYYSQFCHVFQSLLYLMFITNNWRPRVSEKRSALSLRTTPCPEKNGPPKHVQITLWIENDSHYFSLYHE